MSLAPRHILGDNLPVARFARPVAAGLLLFVLTFAAQAWVATWSDEAPEAEWAGE